MFSLKVPSSQFPVLIKCMLAISLLSCNNSAVSYSIKTKLKASPIKAIVLACPSGVG
jgi:hypothetical protein